MTRSVAYLLAYPGASWYFVGEARPRRLFLVDALPQLASTIVGIVVLVVTLDYTFLVTTQLLFNLGAVVRAVLWASQRHGVITAATGSLFVNLPILVVKLFPLISWTPLPLLTVCFGSPSRRFRPCSSSSKGGFRRAGSHPWCTESTGPCS
jgi:hypothetical protein